MLRLVVAVLGVVIGALMGCAVILKSTLLASIAVIAVLALIPISYAVRRVLRVKSVKQGEVLVDEMHVRVSERAGFRAFTASFIAISLIIIVTMWPTFFNVYMVPYEVSEKLFPGLGLSLAILAIAYLAFYAYYARSKKVIE